MSSRRTLLCIIPIFLYITPKGTLNRGKTEANKRGHVPDFAFCSGRRCSFNMVSEQLSSLMLHVTAAYRKLIMWLLTYWSKQTWPYMPQPDRKKLIKMDRTHENFHSVLNMVSWTTRLKGNHLNNLSCNVQLPCLVLCCIVLKQGNNTNYPTAMVLFT